MSYYKLLNPNAYETAFTTSVYGCATLLSGPG